jgi:hypothetical protein
MAIPGRVTLCRPYALTLAILSIPSRTSVTLRLLALRAVAANTTVPAGPDTGLMDIILRTSASSGR